MYQNGLVTGMIGVHLGDTNGLGGGAISFGGVDRTKYRGQVFWSPVVNEGYWEINLNGIKVGDTPFALKAGSTAAIDTGTTLIATNTEQANALNMLLIGATIGSNGVATVDCSSVSSLPNLTFQFDGGEYVLPVNLIHTKYQMDLKTHISSRLQDISSLILTAICAIHLLLVSMD